MDDHMSLPKFFEIVEPDGGSEQVLGLKPNSSPFSTEDLKNCPICRSPMRNINRYGRIVRRAWIDEATKKFIVWANARFVPLTVRLDGIEKGFQQTMAASDVDFGVSAASQAFGMNYSAVQLVKPKGEPDVQYRTFCKLFGKKLRYKSIIQLRYDIARFLEEVSEAEQPFSRIYDLVQGARLHHGIEVQLDYMPEILQTRNRMLATVLLLRCDHTMLLEMLTLCREKPPGSPLWMSSPLDVNFGFTDAIATN